MELSIVLKELVKKQEAILNHYNYIVEEAEKDQNYKVIKEAIEQIAEAIHKINAQDILNNSYLFVNETFEEYKLEELINVELLKQAMEVEQ
ncbi:MAG: hypothetical protein RRX92_04420 [Lachnospiraceae bacterium]